MEPILHYSQIRPKSLFALVQQNVLDFRFQNVIFQEKPEAGAHHPRLVNNSGYEMACTMFPDVTVKQYPDIVTSLIGNNSYNYERDKVLLCCRGDSEKYYSDEEINRLRQKVNCLLTTERIDTTIQVDYRWNDILIGGQYAGYCFKDQRPQSDDRR